MVHWQVQLVNGKDNNCYSGKVNFCLIFCKRMSSCSSIVDLFLYFKKICAVVLINLVLFGPLKGLVSSNNPGARHHVHLCGHFTVHTTHSIVNITLWTLFTPHFTLHTLHYTLHILHYTLNITHFTLYIFTFFHFTLDTVWPDG